MTLLRGVLMLLLIAQIIISCCTAAPRQPPPPGYKHTAFRLIVPQNVIEHGSLHWHDALRHATFLSLRRGIGSYESNSEITLWRRINSAPVSPHLLAKPVQEDADITTMASGVLTSEAGRFSFMPEAALLELGPVPMKLIALWSVLRVRHSGPGLQAPRIEYYFTVQPASHMSLMDHMEKQRNKIVYKKPLPKPKPTYYYKEVTVPVFSDTPGEFYNPQFVSLYRNTVQKYVEQNSEVEVPREEPVQRPEVPLYIIPGPRYSSPPSFPRVSQLAPQRQDLPRLVRVIIPRHQSDPSQENTRNDHVSTLPYFEPRASITMTSDEEKEEVTSDEEKEEMVEVPTIKRTPTTPKPKRGANNQTSNTQKPETTTKWPSMPLREPQNTTTNTIRRATETPQTTMKYSSTTSKSEPAVTSPLPPTTSPSSKLEPSVTSPLPPTTSPSSKSEPAVTSPLPPTTSPSSKSEPAVTSPLPPATSPSSGGNKHSIQEPSTTTHAPKLTVPTTVPEVTTVELTTTTAP